MNIILLTVLLTLLGAGLVVLLVWLSIVSWKSIKFRKKAKTKFEDLNKNLEETTHSIYTNIEEHVINVNNNINEIHNLRNQDLSMHAESSQSIRFDLNSDIASLSLDVESRLKELESSIDSRFDKSHNLRNQDVQNEGNNLQNLRNYTVDRFKELENSINSRFDKIKEK